MEPSSIRTGMRKWNSRSGQRKISATCGSSLSSPATWSNWRWAISNALMLFAIQFTPCQLEYGSSFFGDSALNNTRAHRFCARNFALMVEAVSALFPLFPIKIIREVRQSQENCEKHLIKSRFLGLYHMINQLNNLSNKVRKRNRKREILP